MNERKVRRSLLVDPSFARHLCDISDFDCAGGVVVVVVEGYPEKYILGYCTGSAIAIGAGQIFAGGWNL
jgi:hypothetical protein